MTIHKKRLQGAILLAWVCLTLITSCAQPVLSQSDPSPSAPTAATPALASLPPASPTLPATPTAARPTRTPAPTELPAPTSTSTPETSPTPDLRPTPHQWRSWPVVPSLSWRAGQVYLKGVQLGNNPHAFTRIGDCQSIPDVFLGIYDTDRYWFDDQSQVLQETVDYYKGFFAQESVAARDGFGVASPFSPLMADPEACQANESPIECEFRLKKPAIAFIAMGTNWAPNASDSFEKYLRQIVEFSIERGVIPVLVTKADNIEKDYLLNETIAKVAYDTDMPVFNAWRAIQFLPNHGLKEDGIYLTTEAWDVRSFTALETLDSLRESTLELVPQPGK